MPSAIDHNAANVNFAPGSSLVARQKDRRKPVREGRTGRKPRTVALREMAFQERRETNDTLWGA